MQRNIQTLLPLTAALFIVFSGGALAFPALQFDTSASSSVSVTGGCIVAWASTRGGVVASPCHANGVGWASPQYGAGGAIDFAPQGCVVSPLSFPISETGLVARAFIVAGGDGASFCSTLLDAPCPLRLMQSEEDGAVHFSTSSVLSAVALSIDFAQTAPCFIKARILTTI